MQDDYDSLRILKHAQCLNAHDRSRFTNVQAAFNLRTSYLDDEVPFSAIPVPTESDLHKAEEILIKMYPPKELCMPTKPHGNRGWYHDG